MFGSENDCSIALCKLQNGRESSHCQSLRAEDRGIQKSIESHQGHQNQIYRRPNWSPGQFLTEGEERTDRCQIFDLRHCGWLSGRCKTGSPLLLRHARAICGM
eukprot:scaffold535_cov65-Cylindrotheca_fusiformis.AAC.16